MTSILIYRIGSLGDTLVSLPALWAVRRQFTGARITMLCDYQVRGRYVLAADLLRGSGVVDDFLLYPVDNTPWGRRLRAIRMAKLLLQLRRRRFDTLVYLAPSQRTSEQVERDRRFVRAAGISRLLGMSHGFQPLPQKLPGQALPEVPREADLLLARLKADGIIVPPPQDLRIDLGLGEADEQGVSQWLSGLTVSDGGRVWIAVGPGSKMPAKIWPADRYRQVVQRLIERFDIWPVVFGGAEDAAVGTSLLRSWGRGYLAAGALGLRPSSAALRRCALYLGNDTGTMHMAAAGNVRCVAIFSSRGHPGQWYPYGSGHRVFRTPIDCEGCGLVECIERGMECLMRITPDEVYEACVDVLAQRETSPRGAEPISTRMTATGR